MKKNTLLFSLFLIFHFSFLISPVWAGRPLTTDDAFVAATGKAEFESAITYFKFRDDCNYLNLVTTSKYGLLACLETAMDVVFSFWAKGGRGETGLSDINFKAKYVFNEGAENQPLFALGAAYQPPTGDCDKGLGSGTHDLSLNLIASQKFNKILVHGNLGYTFEFSEENDSFWTAALAGEFPLTPKNTGFLELTARLPGNSSEDKALNCGVGINYQLAENVVTDTAITFGLSSGAPKYVITSGWTYSF